MHTIGEVAARLAESGIPSPIAEACLAIARKIEALPADETQFLTLSYLDPAPQLQVKDAELLAAMNFLTSAPHSPLDAHGYVTINGEIEVLEDEDFRHALLTGDLVHPLTGELERGGLRLVRLFYTLQQRQVHGTEGKLRDV